MAGRLRFVIAFQPGSGHWSRMGAIASVLRQRGHEITLATSESFRDRVEGFHDQFLPIGPVWNEDNLALDTSDEQPAVIDKLRSQSSRIASYFFAAAREVAADLERALSSDPKPDLVVSDYTLLAAAPTAQALGIRWATVFGLSVPFAVEGWPPFGSHLPYTRSAITRQRYGVIEREIIVENHRLYEPIRDLWWKAGVRVLDPWQAYARLGSVGIVASIPDCDFPQPKGFPGHIRYVGPLIYSMDPSDSLDHEASDFVRDRDGSPLVHISLGMTFSSAKSVLRVLVDALGGERLRLLVSCGHVDPISMRQDVRPQRARILYRRTVPHLEVISKSSVLVCHGGANTLMKALHCGVPTLVVPLGAEQRSNGARFAHARIGRMILPSELTSNTIRDTVRALLDPTKGFARRALTLAEKARRSEGAQLAGSLLEQVCQSGCAK